MNQVACPAPDKRRIYALTWGGGGGVQVFEWACPVCGFRTQGHDEQEVRQLVAVHNCSAGWCAIPAPVQPEIGQIGLL